MSLDRSLKTKGALMQHRSVLKRSERVLDMLKKGEIEPDGGNPFALNKMVNRKPVAAKKPKKEPSADEAGEADAASTEES